LTLFRSLNRIFAPEFRKVPGGHLQRAIAVILAGLAIASTMVEGRSTFSARFDPQSIAGPGISQEIHLVLSFFPGDGEAIVRASVGFDPEEVWLVAAHSTRGVLTRSATDIEIDYSLSPLSRALSDSLLIELVPLIGSVDVPFVGSVYSTEKVDAVAHQVLVPLRVRPPIHLVMSARPTHLFVGEQVDMRLQLHNPHADRAVDGVQLRWPEGVSPDLGYDLSDNLNNMTIGPGDSTTTTIRCQVQGDGPRVEQLLGYVISAEAHGSPLSPVELQISGVPQLRVSAASGRLQQGHPQRLTLEWYNPATNATLVADSLRASVPASFEDISVVGNGESGSSAWDVSIEELFFGARDIVVAGPLTLKPGDRIGVELEVVPRRQGPFEWTGSFVPAGTTRQVQAAAGPLVWVDGLSLESDDGMSDDGTVLTDLEAVSMALREQLTRQIQDAPLNRGDRVHLSPTSKKSRSWVVDELLTEALMQKGVTVVVGGSGEDGDDVGTLYYRLVDTRVVYRPSGGALKSIFGTKKRSRDASGDLLLRLETADGSVEWVDRVHASRNDVVDDRQVSWLRSEDVVYAEVNPGNKVIELGLSGSIAIGLLAIFFAP